MSSLALLQRQSLEKNVRLRLQLLLLLLHQQLLLRLLHQLQRQSRSPLLRPLKFKRLRQHRNLQLQRQYQRQYQHPRRHIQCLGMNLRLPELQLRLLTTIRCFTAMTM